MENEINIFELDTSIKQMNGENILQFRMWAEHNLKIKETELKTNRFRAEKGMDNNYSKASKEFEFAKCYLSMVNKEIEKRKMTISKNEINVKENYGIIQQGNHNTAKQDLSKHTHETKIETTQVIPTSKNHIGKGEWITIILAIIAIIVTIAVAYK